MTGKQISYQTQRSLRVESLIFAVDRDRIVTFRAESISGFFQRLGLVKYPGSP